MIKLYRGDCLAVLKRLPAGSVDAVVTDPPYGMGWNVDSSRFSGGVRGHRKTGRGGRGDWRPIVNDDRPFDPAPWLTFPKVILFGSNHFAYSLPVGTTLVWLKRNDKAFGTFLSDGEVAWMKGGYGVYCRRDLSMNRIAGDRVHPNQKPIALMRWCIERLKLKPGSTILDPYMGSGPVGVAAVELGHNYIGCEVDPAYFAIAKRRIKAAEACAVELTA